MTTEFSITGSEKRDERGVSNLLVAICGVVLVGVGAFSVDVGRALWEERQLQTAADAGALAGVARLFNGATVANVKAEGRGIAQANLTAGATVELDDVEVGRWDGATFINGATPRNAVRVRTSRNVPTMLARIWNQNWLRPNTHAVAIWANTGTADCLAPFGITRDRLAGLGFGDTINVGVASPGNWGKIDIRDNMSAGPNFYDAMMNGLCGLPVNVGDAFNSGSGDAKVWDGFNDRMGVNPIVVMPIVNAFPPGDSGVVTIEGFVQVMIVGQTTKNGAKWVGELRFLQGLTGLPNGAGGPGAPPFTQSRVLVE